MEMKAVSGKAKRAIISLFAAASLSCALTPSAAALDAKWLVPLGNAVAITIQSDGVLVVGVPETLPDGKSPSPARDAGVMAGDIITQIGPHRVSSSEELKAAIGKLDGSPVPIRLMRGGAAVNVTLTPHLDEEGRCQLGLWLRDGMSGIGTLTFYDPKTGVFGALGHSVSDVETGVVIPMRSGLIARTYVTDVIQGKAGLPGQLQGTFGNQDILGTLKQNTPCGVFGTMEKTDLVSGKKGLPVAENREIKTGPAVILSNVSGSDVTEYKVEITRVYTGAEAVGRSMMIKVTDPELIRLTGGIVQGMSGSPIIQNGKIVGAVTHVLVNDPTRGYGISIQNMLATIDSDAVGKAA